VQRTAIVIRRSPHQTPIRSQHRGSQRQNGGRGKEGQTERRMMKRTNEHKATPPRIIHSRFSPPSRLARSTHLRSIVEVRHAVAEATELARREKLEVPRLVQRPD